MTDGTTPLVFISHSSQDRHAAIKVCEALERRGLVCWLAQRDIKPGENFQESIVKAIRTARAMVLVFTGHANNSDEIKKEIALASQNHLAVIPLRLEDVLPSDAFLYELSTRQWIDAFGDWDRAMTRLAEQINATPAAPGGTPSPAAHTASPRRKRTPLLAAAAVIVLVVAGGLAYRFGVPSAPANIDVSGNWISGPLINPYDKNQKSVLTFDFDQAGDNLMGSVDEKTDMGDVKRGIQGGAIKGDTIVFYTQGTVTMGDSQQTYKESYRGTLKGGEIQFVRQNDVASGGVPEKFTVKRQ